MDLVRSKQEKRRLWKKNSAARMVAPATHPITIPAMAPPGRLGLLLLLGGGLEFETVPSWWGLPLPVDRPLG